MTQLYHSWVHAKKTLDQHTAKTFAYSHIFTELVIGTKMQD